jgi:pimeloyl-ACP methyl ester carboxylesterase
MQTGSTHSIQLSSGTIHYRALGEGPPLALLHGLSGSGRWWGRNIVALARQFRVYLVDLLGFGRSRGQRFALAEAAQGVLEWMDYLRLEQVSLIGHSMGGYIAIDLAARYPRRIHKIVLVDALALPMDRSTLRSAVGLAHALRYMPFNFLPVLVSDALQAGPGTLLRAGREVLAADISDALERIQAPSLVIWGENDTLLPVQLGELLHRRLPGSQFHLIKHAGHNPMWDRPEQFNRAVVKFLSGY